MKDDGQRMRNDTNAGRSRTDMLGSFDRAPQHRMIHVHSVLRPLRVTCRVGWKCMGVHQLGVENIASSNGSAGGYHCISLFLPVRHSPSLPLTLCRSASLSLFLSVPLPLPPLVSLSPSLPLMLSSRVDQGLANRSLLFASS